MRHGRKMTAALLISVCAILIVSTAALAEGGDFLSVLRRYSARAVTAAENAEIPTDLKLTEREENIFRLGYAAGYDHEGEAAETRSGVSYVLNTNKHKFHRPDCSSVPQIKEKNKRDYVGDRETLLDLGYSPCSVCKP